MIDRRAKNGSRDPVSRVGKDPVMGEVETVNLKTSLPGGAGTEREDVSLLTSFDDTYLTFY